MLEPAAHEENPNVGAVAGGGSGSGGGASEEARSRHSSLMTKKGNPAARAYGYDITRHVFFKSFLAAAAAPRCAAGAAGGWHSRLG